MSEVSLSFVSTNIIALEIDTGSVQQGILTPYTAMRGDKVSTDGVLWRDKVPVGLMSGPNAEHYLPFDKFSDTKFSSFFKAGADGADPAEKIASYALTVDGRPVSIAQVSTKSEVVGSAQVSRYDFSFVEKHTVYLHLAEPVPLGGKVAIGIGKGLAEAATTFDPASIESDAVHVSQIGFHPGDGHKVAYLSAWTGFDGAHKDFDQSVSYAEGTRFSVIDVATGAVVHEGAITRTFDHVHGVRDQIGTDVYKMDFSAVTKPGEYKVVVDGVGASTSFQIATTVWADAFELGLKGLYSQRSNIEISPDHSTGDRPAALAEGEVTVHQSTATLMDTSMGLNLRNVSSFTALEAGATTKVVTGAFGGWNDAGDWDRRIQNTETARDMLTLAELNPAFINSFQGTAPDLINGVPAVIEEALWGIDVFRQMQGADGGISGGIESNRDSKVGEVSWDTSMKLFAYAPDAWSSYEYATVAARAARVLEAYDAGRAQLYLDSAERAFAWAEAHVPGYAATNQTIINSKNLAAAELFKTTEKDSYEAEYLESSSYLRNSRVTGEARQVEAAWVYSTSAGADAQVVANGKANVLAYADAVLKAQAATAFGNADFAAIKTAFGNTAVTPYIAAQVLVYAHQMSGDAKYLNAIVSDTMFGLGANPNNLVYTTGLGENNVSEITNVDGTALGKLPEGISVFGLYDRTSFGDQYWLKYLDADMQRDYKNTPVAETFLGFDRATQVAEYSVANTIGPNLFVWGYIASLHGDVSTSSLARPIVAASPPISLEERLFNAADRDDIDVLARLAHAEGLQDYAHARAESVTDTLKIKFTPDGNVLTIQDMSEGRSLLVGTDGADRILGRAGDDVIFGGGGVDRLFGGDGADTIFADGDHAWGDAGDDILIALDGGARLRGGEGADRFVVMEQQGDRVEILDFEIGVDRLDLSHLIEAGTPVNVTARNGHVTIDADGTLITLRDTALEAVWSHGSFTGNILL